MFHAQLENPGQGCPGVGPAPTPEISAFANRFHHRDHLGTLRVVTSDSGTVLEALDFCPFGMEMAFRGAGSSSSRKFMGHERDERTGLDYMRARYKGSWSDRFASADPIRAASVYAPTSWNLYAYVLGNPISYSDPSGLSAAAEDTPIQTEHQDDITVVASFLPAVFAATLGGSTLVPLEFTAPNTPPEVVIYLLRKNDLDSVKKMKQKACELALESFIPDEDTNTVGLGGIGGAAMGWQVAGKLGVTADGKVLAILEVVWGGVIGEILSGGLVRGGMETDEAAAIRGWGAQGGGSFTLGPGWGGERMTNLTNGHPSERWKGGEFNVTAGQGLEVHLMVTCTWVQELGSIAAACDVFVAASGP